MKFLLLTLALFLIAGPAFAQMSDLIISEYIEGSSYNKALEIHNGTEDVVNLGAYTLELYINGSTVPSVVELWAGANWLEREVWDLMGIRFEGHPDLRRIVLPDAFTAHPLRKDYPLQGRGERHNLPVITREEG